MAASCREDLIQYALRKLGHPAMQINVTPEQIYDRVDDALARYWEAHHEGSYRDFIKYQIQELDIANGYLPVDEWVYSVLRVIPIGGMYSPANLEYMSLMQSIGGSVANLSGGIVNYTVAMSYLSMINDFFNRQSMLRFNQRQNKVFFDTGLTNLVAGDFVVLEVYRFSDPNLFRETWNDQWLKGYTTALIKRQWGQNMLKYSGFQLPSGITLNGRDIYQDALGDLEALEAQLLSSETLPTDFFMRLKDNGS
jgi:hypothetical protein